MSSENESNEDWVDNLDFEDGEENYESSLADGDGVLDVDFEEIDDADDESVDFVEVDGIDFEDASFVPADEIDFEGDIDLEEDFPLEGSIVSVEPASKGELAEMSRAEAEEITEHIRSTAQVMHVLIARAHAGKAYKALGYKNFEAYVKEEFNISRSRAYQFLNQAAVIKAIEEAAPEGTEIHVTEAAARDLKNAIEELAPAIKEATTGVSPDESRDIIADLVENFRGKDKEKNAGTDFTYDDLDLEGTDIDFGDFEGGGGGGGRGEFDDFDNLGDLGELDENDIQGIMEEQNRVVTQNVTSIFSFRDSMNHLAHVAESITPGELIDLIFESQNGVVKPIQMGIEKFEWLAEFKAKWDERLSVSTSEESVVPEDEEVYPADADDFDAESRY